MSYGNLGNGRKVVTTGGTPLQLSSTNLVAERVIITALSTNTGVVTIGTSSVRAAAGSENGVILKATSPALELYQADLSKIYVDAAVNGEGVTFIYEY